MKRFLYKLLCIPKSVFFNFYYFPISKAIRLPVFVSYDVKLQNMGSRNSVLLSDFSKRILLGFGESFALGGRTYWSVADDAKIIFNGSAVFGKGTQIISGGGIEFGDRFYCNADCIINANNRIRFGNDVLIGWRSTIIDGDGHQFFSTGEHEYEEINIGNHVWIASEVTLLKGTVLSDGTVVASKGCITKTFDQENLLIGGFNKILRQNISWKR